MLNKKDYITLKLLFLKYEKAIEVDVRILGVTIERVYKKKEKIKREIEALVGRVEEMEIVEDR